MSNVIIKRICDSQTREIKNRKESLLKDLQSRIKFFVLDIEQDRICANAIDNFIVGLSKISSGFAKLETKAEMIEYLKHMAEIED